MVEDWESQELMLSVELGIRNCTVLQNCLREVQDLDVKQIYTQLLKEGYSKKDAAKEAQARTGVSVVSGRPIDKQLHFNQTKNTVFGQYTEVRNGK